MNKKQYAGLFAGVVTTTFLMQGLFVYALQGQTVTATSIVTKQPTAPVTTPSVAPPTLQPAFQQVLFDYLWKNTFRYTTFFESLDGFHALGNASVDGNQLILSTRAEQNASAEVFKQPEWQGILSFNERSAFRTAVTINNEDSMAGFITVGMHDTNGYGFKIDNRTLYGVSANNGKQEIVRLTPLSSGVYNLSARLEPKSSVAFYVNDQRLGSITKILPAQDDIPLLQIMDVWIMTKDSVAKSIQLSFFDYMQTRGSR